jgi:hypothetical protein
MFSCVALIFSLSLSGTYHAIGVSDETPILLSNCKSAEVIPCIDSLVIETPDGVARVATLTGRNGGRDVEFSGIGYEEYSVDGLTFEGTSKNLLIPRVVYYPSGPNKQRDFLAAGVQPSWLNRDLNPTENLVEVPHRSTSLLCGTVAKREKCLRSNNFNSNIKFLFTFRVPSEFIPIWASGSTKDAQIDWTKRDDASSGWYRLPVTIGTLEREMVLLTDFYSSPIEAIESSPYADFSADWPGLWIHSSRDSSVNLLNECRQTPFLSVTTNAIYQEVPKWNPVTESIDLKLFAPHLKVDGSLNRGFYELRISESLAKCFWGISVSSNTRASITISYPGSDKEAVVETVITSFKDGIFQVQATNFTFSSPTIKAKILSQTSISDSNSAIASVKPVAVKKVISCVKGKVTKKVTAIKPKCPAGYMVKK